MAALSAVDDLRLIFGNLGIKKRGNAIKMMSRGNIINDNK